MGLADFTRSQPGGSAQVISMRSLGLGAGSAAGTARALGTDETAGVVRGSSVFLQPIAATSAVTGSANRSENLMRINFRASSMAKRCMIAGGNHALERELIRLDHFRCRRAGCHGPRLSPVRQGQESHVLSRGAPPQPAVDRRRR